MSETIPVVQSAETSSSFNEIETKDSAVNLTQGAVDRDRGGQTAQQTAAYGVLDALKTDDDPRATFELYISGFFVDKATAREKLSSIPNLVNVLDGEIFNRASAADKDLFSYIVDRIVDEKSPVKLITSRKLVLTRTVLTNIINSICNPFQIGINMIIDGDCTPEQLSQTYSLFTLKLSQGTNVDAEKVDTFVDVFSTFHLSGDPHQIYSDLLNGNGDGTLVKCNLVEILYVFEQALLDKEVFQYKTYTESGNQYRTMPFEISAYYLSQEGNAGSSTGSREDQRSNSGNTMGDFFVDEAGDRVHLEMADELDMATVAAAILPYIAHPLIGMFLGNAMQGDVEYSFDNTKFENGYYVTTLKSKSTGVIRTIKQTVNKKSTETNATEYSITSEFVWKDDRKLSNKITRMPGELSFKCLGKDDGKEYTVRTWLSNFKIVDDNNNIVVDMSGDEVDKLHIECILEGLTGVEISSRNNVNLVNSAKEMIVSDLNGSKIDMINKSGLTMLEQIWGFKHIDVSADMAKTPNDVFVMLTCVYGKYFNDAAKYIGCEDFLRGFYPNWSKKVGHDTNAPSMKRAFAFLTWMLFDNRMNKNALGFNETFVSLFCQKDGEWYVQQFTDPEKAQNHALFYKFVNEQHNFNERIIFDENNMDPVAIQQSSIEMSADAKITKLYDDNGKFIGWEMTFDKPFTDDTFVYAIVSATDSHMRRLIQNLSFFISVKSPTKTKTQASLNLLK